jgi:hypothetical protein
MTDGPGPKLEIVSRGGKPCLRVLVKKWRVSWNPALFNTEHMEIPLNQETMHRLDDEFFKAVSR